MAETNSKQRNANLVTGPTSGIGYRTALELAQRGTVVLVGRDQGKLDKVRRTIEERGQHAVMESRSGVKWARAAPRFATASSVAKLRTWRTFPGHEAMAIAARSCPLSQGRLAVGGVLSFSRSPVWERICRRK